MSGLAILLCQLPAAAQVTGLLLVIFWVCHLVRRLSHCRILRHHGGPDDTNNHWTLAEESVDLTTGSLVHKGYRSAGLLILVLRSSDCSKNHRIPVWRDSVSALEFSYLSLQLLFNTTPPGEHDERA